MRLKNLFSLLTEFVIQTDVGDRNAVYNLFIQRPIKRTHGTDILSPINLGEERSDQHGRSQIVFRQKRDVTIECHISG